MLFLCRSSAELSQILTQLVIALSEVAFHVSKLLMHAERTKLDHFDDPNILEEKKLTDQQAQEGCVEEGNFVVSARVVHVNR